MPHQVCTFVVLNLILLFPNLSLALWPYNDGGGAGYFKFALDIANSDVVQCVNQAGHGTNILKVFDFDCSDLVFKGRCRAVIDLLKGAPVLGVTVQTATGISNWVKDYVNICNNQTLVAWEDRGMVARDMQIAFDRIWKTGFVEYMQELWATCCDCTISFSGHNYGACLAQMIGLKFFKDLWWPASQMFLIVYGSPRCGNEDFAYYVNQAFVDRYRVNWINDPVPQYPTTTCDRTGAAQLGRCTSSYFHCCTNIMYTRWGVMGGKYTTCPLSEDATCLKGTTPTDHYAYYTYNNPSWYDNGIC